MEKPREFDLEVIGENSYCLVRRLDDLRFEDNHIGSFLVINGFRFNTTLEKASQAIEAVKAGAKKIDLTKSEPCEPSESEPQN